VAPGGLLTSRDAPVFDVHLDCFTGPFDLLLGLIAKHRLDITEVSLAVVTDEFIAHLRRLTAAADAARDAVGDPTAADEHLGQASGFLLVAATLLDLKTAALLPSAEVEDAEDLALLEARDLLFARLLQHRAYAQVAAVIGASLQAQARSVPRSVPLEAPLAAALPDLVWTTTPADLAGLAAAALAPPPPAPGVATEHLHAPTVSIPAQVELLAGALARSGTADFAALVADAEGTAVVVGRFLALLELYRRGWVDLDQEEALGGLTVHWTGAPVAA
jgi:segregation and condensation protein A